jgi:hypothetical protein
MRSKFKSISLDKKSIYKLTHFNSLIFQRGDVPVLPFLKIIGPGLQKVSIHDGKTNMELKLNVFKMLRSDNFFFLRELKVGNFVFPKKHCIFKKSKKK